MIHWRKHRKARGSLGGEGLHSSELIPLHGGLLQLWCCLNGGVCMDPLLKWFGQAPIYKNLYTQELSVQQISQDQHLDQPDRLCS